MKVKIALVQLDIVQFSPEENVRKMENFTREASGNGADIVIFPEDCITGPVVEKKEYVDFEKKYVSHFQKVAQEFKIDIVPGSIIEGDKNGWYNTTYYIDKSGKVKAEYRKVHLWHPERTYINPGNQITTFYTQFGRVGLIICWDLAFPEIFRAMVKRGVDIVICPSYWCFEDAGKGVRHNKNAEIEFVDALCVTRAFENEIILVYSNAAGVFKDKNYKNTLIGHSQITLPFKGAVARLEHNREEMIIQKVDTLILKDARSQYKIREDLRNLIY